MAIQLAARLLLGGLLVLGPQQMTSSFATPA